MVLTKFCGDEKCLSEDIVYIWGFFYFQNIVLSRKHFESDEIY